MIRVGIVLVGALGGQGEGGGVDSFKGPLTGTYVNESSFLMTDQNLAFIALKKFFLH